MLQKILAGKPATVTKSFLCLLVAVGMWLALSAASAGPIEDARKLLKEGKYDQVDTVLKEQLASVQPPAEALVVSLDAAVAQGKVITAQRRITRLLKITSNADLKLVYRGAMISEQAGERRMALSRYLTYVRKQKGSDDRMRHALEYLISEGKFPAEYKKYISLFGTKNNAWSMGMALIRRLVVDQETTAALDVASFMMETLKPDPKQASSLGKFLNDASHRGYLGTDLRKRYILPLQTVSRRRMDDPEQLVRMCEQAYRYLSGKESADILTAIHEAAGGPVNERCLILFDRLRFARQGGESLALARTIYQKLEPIYRAGKTQGAYAGFIDRLCKHRESFVTKDETVFDKDTLSKLLASAKQKGARNQIDNIISRLCADAELRTALARKHAADILPAHASWVIGPISGNPEERKAQIKAAKPFVAAFAKGRDVRGTILANAALMDWYNKIEDKNALLGAAKSYMAAFPADFEWNSIWRYVWQSKLLSLNEKLTLLREQHAGSGPCAPLEQIIPNRIARDPALRKEPVVQALSRGYRRKGNNPVLRAAVMAHSMNDRRRKVSPDSILAGLMRGYTKPLPSGLKAPADVNEVVLTATLNRLLPQIKRIEQIGKFKLADRMAPGPIMASLLGRMSTGNPYTVAGSLAGKLKGSDPDTMKIWRALSYAKNPKGDAKSLFAPYYGKMGSDNALRYFVGQMGVWHQRTWRDQYNPKACWSYETFLGELEKLAGVKGFEFGDAELAGHVRSIILRWQGAKGKKATKARASKKLVDAMWRGYLARSKASGKYDTDFESSIYLIHQQRDQAHGPAWINEYSKSLASRGATEQVRSIDAMMRTVGNQKVLEDKGKSLYLRLFTMSAGLYGKMSDQQWQAVGVRENVRGAAGMLAKNTPWRTALKDQAKLLETGTKLTETFETRLLAGVPLVGGHNPVPALCEQTIKTAAEKGDWAAAISATRRLAENLDDGRRADNYRSSIVASARALQDVGASEILYAFLRQIEQQAKISSTMGKEIAILRARAARDISGLIAVSPNDASYPLHLAAQALLLGNETRAWELSQSQSKLFATSWEGLDANFVAWYVRALFKQKNYEQVTTLGRSILKKESSLDAETAAAIYLAMGDVQRAQENNDAAIVIYKALQTSDRYKDTRAGRESRYRNVMLMISTGAYGDAEDALALMVESPSIDEQAEAYFLLAKLADEQKEYRQADKYLTQVRSRVPDHIEAAFLEGELRAKAPSMLARGEELEIGVVAMETVAVPGRELVFRLQDSNLAIAKGSSSIPITIETSTGKDKETVNLVLSGSVKNMFKGTIVTALGRVSQGDRVLQLRGEDVVSYRIEDEFQKSHELTYKPKKLEVKADGELSASAGRILSELEIEQRQVERKLALARGEKPPAWTLERRKSVRPGSPIYVRVIDFDRNLTDDPDKVTVAVKTTGGDVLKAVALTETGDNTGVFMGTIPTSMPLPMGRASDTFEGKNASWTINSKTAEIWSSLDDGVKPKWIEADTMTSHMVSSVSIALPDSQKVKQITLTGSLAEDLGMLATYPAKTAKEKDDLALARGNATPTGASPLNTLKSIRTRVQGNIDPKAAVNYIQATSVVPAGADEAGILSGTFISVTEQMLAMKIVAKGMGNNSRAYLLIDGKQELGGKLSDIADKTASVFLRKGAHKMELVYRSAGKPGKDAGISVSCAGEDKKFAAMPAKWFSVEHTPELVEAIMPNGTITLKDNVFTAAFRKPIRMRTVRWNFIDFAGKDISVKKITVLDAAGKRIIPVEKDFTSSLTNDILEIAPGDRISLMYVDKKNLQDDDGRRRAGMGLGRGASLSVGFSDGEILLAHEEVVTDANGNTDVELFPARRCSSGDVLTLVIDDQDIDQTPNRDKVSAIVTTSSGAKLDIEILEEQSIDSKGEVHEVCHTGRFVATFRLVTVGAPKPKPTTKPATQPTSQPAIPTIAVKGGDEIVVRYLDTENNDGVPMDRVSRLTEGGAGFGGWSVTRTRTELVPDKSADAVLLVSDLRRLSNDPELQLYRQNILHLSPKVKANEADEEPTIDRGVDKNGLPVCSVRGPLQFSLLYPRMARNTGSTIRIAAVVESEIKAAKAEKRKTKGAIVTMDIPDEDELEAGRFYGTVNLQIGVPGDKLALDAAAAQLDPDELPIKTIIARGDDIVQLRFKDPTTGKTDIKRVRLLSDGRLEVLERTMRARKLSIHLGQKFYLRVADPDKDTSNARDTVTVAVKSKSGDAVDLELTETMIHSGVFTGSVEPRWIKDRKRDEAARKAAAEAAAKVAKAAAEAAVKAAKAAEAARRKAAATTQPASAPATRPAVKPVVKPKPIIVKPVVVVYADFGDTVSFRYIDKKAVSTSEPRVLDLEGNILHGANGTVALFSKEYKDPEMAVKTAFLTAEAMFSIAKDLRKKKRTELANSYISHGKSILELALHNYPNTTLVAQGEYLVATLAQELGNYSEAIGKYSEVVQRWTKSSYAPKALYRIGQCYETQGNFERAGEEYVRVTYLFPNSPEVPQATLRLGRHYLTVKNYAVAGRIFEKFHDNNPKHRLAAKTLFLAGECYRLSERYKDAIGVFIRAGKQYRDNKQIRSESLYWQGVCARELKDYVMAYRTLKRLTWDYPESERAADARKLLGTDELQLDPDEDTD
ncbi:MAG: tetratricopeptide repeat protein [Phycisphaerae bacterium]|jgi:TolA-binding protein|nr:tetratricopeptide repeat protein [Phycisphaerae bacterium]